MEKRINIFGSSIAWGASDNELGGWINRLRLYAEKNIPEYAEIYNLGISGDDTEGLRKRFLVENEARNPNVIMIEIGVNDSCHDDKNNLRIPIDKYAENLQEIVREAKKFTDKIIFIGSFKADESKTKPVAWGNFYYENEVVARYDARAKEICAKNNLLFIEMADVLELSDLEDGLHPNAMGHEKMFQRIKDFLVENKIF